MQQQFLPLQTADETTPYVTPPITAQTAVNAEILPSTQAVTALLADIQHKAIFRKKRLRRVLLLLCMYCVAAFFYMLLPGLHHWLDAHGMVEFFCFIISVFCFLNLFVMGQLAADSGIELLVQSAGKQAIPALIEALSLNASPAYNKPYIQALMTLLPQLQATDTTLLTPTHRRFLNALLRRQLLTSRMGALEHPLSLAILKAYEQVGDAAAISIVERLSRRKPYNDHQRKIQQAAAECLPLLRANVGNVQTTQTLLRASIPETNTPDTLLRAATATTHPPNDELLRAATPYFAEEEP